MWGTLPATDKKIGGVAEVKDGDGVGEAGGSNRTRNLLFSGAETGRIQSIQTP